MEDSSLIFSDDAKINIYYFYEGINDVNFFVEDHNKAYEYETILNKVFMGKITIGKIFDMNGKQSLINAFKTFGSYNSESDRNNFYLADGDFDRLIKPDDMISDNCFFYLNCYNIENCLIDESSLFSFAKGLLKEEDIIVKSKLDFENWQSRIVEEVTPLFLNYCFVQKHYPDKPTISLKLGHFIDYKTGFKRQDINLKDYINKFIIDPSLIDEVEVDSYKSELEENGVDKQDFICGKFLLTSISSHIKNISNKKFREDDFKWYLISHFNAEKLNDFKSRVLRNI